MAKENLELCTSAVHSFHMAKEIWNSARVKFTTLTHGNSKNEIRRRDGCKMKTEKSEYGKKK